MVEPDLCALKTCYTLQGTDMFHLRTLGKGKNIIDSIVPAGKGYVSSQEGIYIYTYTCIQFHSAASTLPLNVDVSSLCLYLPSLSQLQDDAIVQGAEWLQWGSLKYVRSSEPRDSLMKSIQHHSMWFKASYFDTLPIPSMYGGFTYIYHTNQTQL